MTRTFSNPHDEYLWEGAVLSGVVQGQGDADGPVGWFAPITLVGFSDYQSEPGDMEARQFYGTDFLVLIEKGDTVRALPFRTVFEQQRHVGQLEHVLLMLEAGVTDADLQQAISGYRRALEWDAGHDGKGYSWDERAEWASNDDVTRFVCANIGDIRTYMAVTKQSFEGVGADFAFSRVDSTAARMGGFQNLAGGETVDDLVAAARRFGKVTVVVNEKQEMEVLPDA